MKVRNFRWQISTSLVPALIAVLVTQISRADERLVEGKEKAVINLKTSAATNNAAKKLFARKSVTGSHLKRRVCLKNAGKI